MDTLIFATNNPHKLSEVKLMLGEHYKIIGLSEAGISEDVPETADTLQGNAEQKTDYIHQKLNMNVFADDTGLEVEALNMEPGVYSARYAGPEKDSTQNMQKLLHEMVGITNRKAQFRTVICLIINNEKYFFEGKVEGEILDIPKGQAGFGYDPVFEPHGYTVSFAEMPMDEKNKISHRGRAVNKLVNFLKNKPNAK